jgi:hypothetical protein
MLVAPALAALWPGLGMPSAWAQEENRTSTVTERPRPELDALGVRAGGFLIFPGAMITASFDDNIFSSSADTVDDLITNISPRIRINSDWRNHELKLFGDADIALHADRSAEDYEDFRLGGQIRLDILRDARVTAGLV